MIVRVETFGAALERRLCIRIACGCGKRVVYRCSDFRDVLKAEARIENVRWRCEWCAMPPAFVSYVDPAGIDRESLTQWTPRRPKSVSAK